MRTQGGPWPACRGGGFHLQNKDNSIYFVGLFWGAEKLLRVHVDEAPNVCWHPTQTIANPPSVLKGQNYRPRFKAKETGVHRGSEPAQGHRHRRWGINPGLPGSEMSHESKTPLQISTLDIQSQPSCPLENRMSQVTYHPRMGLGSFRILIVLPQVSCPCQHAWKGTEYSRGYHLLYPDAQPLVICPECCRLDSGSTKDMLAEPLFCGGFWSP